MSKNTCTTCQKPKAQLQCGHCATDTCKNCAEFLNEDHFSFYSNPSSILKHSVYCANCFDQHIVPAITDYEQLMNQAKNIRVFLNTQGKESRWISRVEAPVLVENCRDHDETLLRLAFLAAEKGYNGLVDVAIVSKKIREGSYQKSIWQGSGIPANIEEHKIIKSRSFWQNPN